VLTLHAASAIANPRTARILATRIRAMTNDARRP
jgi:hypothetical protein